MTEGWEKWPCSVEVEMEGVRGFEKAEGQEGQCCKFHCVDGWGLGCC